jgi:hypothetical protein
MFLMWSVIDSHNISFRVLIFLFMKITLSFLYVHVSLSSCVFYYVFGYKMTTYNEIKSLKKN